MAPILATVAVEWLHACGRREFDTDQEYLVLRRYKVGGFYFYELQVPWQEAPWTVAVWRLTDEV